MSKEFEIVLDGQTYRAKRFNLGELREVAQMVENKSTMDAGFEMLGMILKRAEPPVEDWTKLEPTQDELKAALDAILEAAGLRKAGEAKPAAETAPAV